MAKRRAKKATRKRSRLCAALRLEAPHALGTLEAALEAQDGCVRATAAALGIPEQTLWSIAREIPAVRAVLARHGIGRSGVREYRMTH